MTARAVLWDVGGPLNTEVTHERLIDEDIKSALHAAGRDVSEAAYNAANEWAVHTYAPNAYKAIIWRLSGEYAELAQRVYQQVEARSHLRNQFEMRPKIPELLADLHGRGVLMGLAANQPLATIARLDEFGVGRFFKYRGVSGSHSIRKPDTRLFALACEDLGVQPTDCVMVGDRIDNDIAPAKSLGMRAILFRTGRHRGQRARSWDDLPDAEVHAVEDLRGELFHLLDAPAGN